MFRRFFSTSLLTRQLSKPKVAHGIRGEAKLVTGNFAYFTKPEADVIQGILKKDKAFVLVFDRDSIAVPANERAMWIRSHFEHHPNLEVRVAYNPPSEQHGTNEEFSDFIRRYIPGHVDISEVICNNEYSELLAIKLGADFTKSDELNKIREQEPDLKKNPAGYQAFLFPHIAKRIISPFNQVMDEGAFIADYERQIAEVKDYIDKNNVKSQEFYARTPWDLRNLNRINYPYIIGHIADEAERETFSHLTNVQVFDAPIYMPGQGWKIPLELSPYRSVIAKMAAAESLSNPAMKECNAYLTVDAGVVFPHGYARREGLHVDGFLTKANSRPDKQGIVWGDNTYVVSDQDKLQTEFYPGPFDLSNVDVENPQAVLKAFEEQGKSIHYIQHRPYEIARLTTNNVHAVHANLSGEYLPRCFLKMTFSERLFNRSGNTYNPNFNYRFMYVPREAGRNTQNFSGLVPEGFAEVDLKDIHFAAGKFPN